LGRVTAEDLMKGGADKEGVPLAEKQPVLVEGTA